MKRIALAVALLVTLAAPAWGQDFEKGQDAYESGDYLAALSEWRPLAEQGHADAQFNLGSRPCACSACWACGTGLPALCSR